MLAGVVVFACGLALIAFTGVVFAAPLRAERFRWHHSFGKRVLPTLIRRMRLYAVGVFALACLLLYGAFRPA